MWRLSVRLSVPFGVSIGIEKNEGVTLEGDRWKVIEREGERHVWRQFKVPSSTFKMLGVNGWQRPRRRCAAQVLGFRF